MSEVWQTIEQAAVTLGLSVRTVNRHITAGKLQSRLYDGRREVLIVVPEEPPRAERVPPGGASAGGGRVEESFATAGANSGSFAPGVSEPMPQAVSDDEIGSFRQTVSAQVATDRPMDMQTMLALADSIDDKATLAVAAYQTLARSSETQVQSLRRMAFGAWAVVGLIAVGIIVAVGWVTHRVTNAEVNATYLAKEVVKQTNLMDQLAAERDRTRVELQAVRRQADEMRDKLARAADRAEQERLNAAAMANSFVAAVGQLQNARPTTAPTTVPSAGAPATPVSLASSATQPSASVQPSPVSPVPAPPSTRPAEAGTNGAYMFASPASRPAVAPVPRAPNPGNTIEAFGPR